MRVQFWGTRGSIATPGPDTVRYGGNTSCISVRTRSGTQLVLDAGTGLRKLGMALMEQGETARRGHLLIGHTHWDHIQGFPFFAPLFDAAHEWDVYAPRGFGSSLRDTLAGQMQYNYFPVNLDEMGAVIRYHDLVEGEFMIDDVRITARYLNHPALTLGYRLEADGITVVYSSDHECLSRASALGAPLGQVLGSLHPGENRHQQFISGADLLIHDTQYTAAEYPKHVGWGHSTMEYVDLAIAGGVRQLAMFHHDPRRDDAAVDALVAEARTRVAKAGSATEVFAAAEGAIVELNAPAARVAPAPDTADVEIDTEDIGNKHVLVACADADLAERLVDAVQAEGLQVVVAGSGDEALAAVPPEALALAIVSQRLGNEDGLAVVDALRAGQGADRLPAIVVASAGATPGSALPHSGEPAAAGTSAASTEWVTPPFTRQYLRTKLQAGILRARARWQAPPLPEDEDRRVEALRRLEILDTPPEERFDRITRLAARMFGVPIALISLVDAERQWFKSRFGLHAQQTSRDESFCAHAIFETRALVVPDALGDDRFADNPLVQSEPRVRFYAGQPIAAPDGSLVGTLCLIDHHPRHLTQAEIMALADLAAMVERELDLDGESDSDTGSDILLS